MLDLYSSKQWNKKDFIDWERTGEPQFANSTIPYQKMEDDRIQSWIIANVTTKYYRETARVY